MDVVELARSFVDIPSPTGDEGRMAEASAAVLRDAGFDVQLLGVAAGRANVLATRAAPRVLLCTHLDTVPPHVPAGEDEDWLYGRGACDMKGPIAAQLLAVERVARSGRSLSRPLALAYTFAEETGCDGALALVAGKSQLGDLGPASCLVGEPTGLAPMTGHKGYWIAHLRLRGVPAHSSRPALGADASRALALLLEELHRLRRQLAQQAPDTGLQPPETTLNTGLVRAGLARNVIPDRAEVVVELRPVPGVDAPALQRAVADCVERATAVVPGTEGEVEWIETMPAFAQDRSAPLVAWLRERTGKAPGVIPFYTEAELYRAGLGLPTAVCGPGSIDQAHRVDESVLFDELLAGEQLYADAIAAFCG